MISGMLILNGDMVGGYKCATLWYDLYLTFDHAVMTQNCKILFGL